MVIYPVSGVDGQADAFGEGCTGAKAFEFGATPVRADEGASPGTGVEFDHPGTDFGGLFDLFGIGINEQADVNAAILEGAGGVANPVKLTDAVKTSLGGDLGAVLGYEAGAVGSDAEGNRGHFGSGGHFEVHPGSNGFADAFDVAVDDVTTVLAEVNGDPVGTVGFGGNGDGDGIRFDKAAAGGRLVAVAGLPEGGRVVDIDAEEEGFECHRNYRYKDRILV